MTKKQAVAYIKSAYGTDADYPWEDIDAFVFRHRISKKWFCLFMDVPASCLGLNEQKTITIINLKVPKALREDLLREEGIHPAYHMNKQHWISLDLRKATKKMLEVLMDISFKATAMKKDL
ncbi:MAG: MmcQ/YjbR family DNA-binding protein [Anaerovibrio sp.]|uniref:MmcQ/YjbR family DNA-binding protein n=1 Tax=Anaerovibrio sp. TaxID=1872532 RepID=UPI0025E4DE36|nr:MmcQ/YjbR family DNA-binding protein [Anaerovibrio sp.]MCR5175361.1 MmcQ/YjbR family DNA-binding protein [Anaerovibrio sp.]